MGRREFITLLGGAAAWPVAARAQQPERMRRVGVFTNLASDDPEAQARIGAFTQGLHVRCDYLGRPLIIPVIAKYSAELVALGPDVILCVAGAA
jgi:putative ABC transport system substrate-binding protein